MIDMTSQNDDKEKIYVVLRLHKNIARILRIFANTHANKEGGGTEEKRIDNFLSEEVTKIVQTLAADPEGPPQERFPDSLKQLVQKLLKEVEESSSKEDLK